MAKHLGQRLPHLVEGGDVNQVLPLKLLTKGPRSSQAKVFHGLPSSKGLLYAEQVQVS